MKIIAAVCLSPFLLCSSIAGAIIEPSGFDSGAIDTALEQSKPGDTIQLREGVYRLNKAISVPSQRKLVGAGQTKTKLVFAGEKAGVLVTLNGCEDVELAHLTLDGENNPLVHQGIGGSNARRLWLHHLTIRNLKAKTWGPHGILFSGRNMPTRGTTVKLIANTYFFMVCPQGKELQGHSQGVGFIRRNRPLHPIIAAVGLAAMHTTTQGFEFCFPQNLDSATRVRNVR